MRRVSIDVTARNIQLFLGIVALLTLSFALAGCGGTSSAASTPPPTQPTQPTYPSVPPVPITWSPSTSPLPAPPAQVPPPTPSTDFPLTVSNPTAGVSLTSPINVVATATPKNPIFFMRVYVDQLAVYFTFDNSIDTQIFIAPGQHTIEVMAEDNQGYISATPITVTVTTQAAQTTISNIQSMPGWQSCSATFPPRIRTRGTDLRRRLGHRRLDDDSESIIALHRRPVGPLHPGRNPALLQHAVLQSRGRRRQRQPFHL